MFVTVNGFSKFQTVKILVRPLSKERRFRTCFYIEHVKARQMLGKFLWERFCHVFLSFSVKLIWKMSPQVLGEMLEVFVNTLRVDDKYPVQGCENLQLPIQMQLSGKRKTVFSIFCSISGFYLKFWTLWKKRSFS